MSVAGSVVIGALLIAATRWVIRRELRAAPGAVVVEPARPGHGPEAEDATPALDAGTHAAHVHGDSQRAGLDWRWRVGPGWRLAHESQVPTARR